jgi:endonuclease/exonuclease/phosphatase family metal-dependent hydrolase
MEAALCFFNANNLFLRYKMGRKYPGDISGKSYIADTRWGFVPPYSKGLFKPFRPEQTALSAAAVSSEGLPAILCMCEVENLLALRKFNEDFLGNRYNYALLIDSRDYRQIDVGILTTKDILSVRSHMDCRDNKGNFIFSRDCLEVVLGLNKSGSKRLTLFINHLKSKFVDRRNKTPQKIAAEMKRANERRKSQVKKVRKIVISRFPGNSFNTELFAVIGDFNDQPESPWVKPLTRQAGLHDIIGYLPAEEQWTYWWKGPNRVSQIDYILLSPALANAVQRRGILPRIERRGIGIKGFLQDGSTKPGTTRIFKTDDDPNPQRIDFQFPRFKAVVEKMQFASDHCPVFVEIPY